MNKDKLPFLSYFIFCLAIGVGVYFSFILGIPQIVYQSDLSHMTSLIALIFLGTVIWSGYQTWNIEKADSSWGHIAEKLVPVIGLVGTALGLSFQAKALLGGAAAFGPLATSLYCTVCGGIGMALILIMTFIIDHGIKNYQK